MTLAEKPDAISRSQDHQLKASSHQLLTQTAQERSGLWLLAAWLVQLIWAALAMAPAFRSADVVQDDARQYVFWLARIRDPELFRGDLIAEYYESMAPPAYRALFWVLSRFAEPLVTARLLPFVLGSLVALLTYLLVRRFHTAPLTAFLASALLSGYLWLHHDLSSATPRSLAAPLLLALLLAMVSKRRILSVALVILTAAAYPVGACTGVALLAAQLIHVRDRRLLLSRSRSDWFALILAALTSAALILPLQQAGSRFGPLVSVDQARSMPAFGEDGRVPIFFGEPLRFLADDETGFDLTVRDPVLRFPVFLEALFLALPLPLLLLLRRRIRVGQAPRPESLILVRLLLTSASLYVLSNLLLFHLYLPNRYVRWSIPIVLCVSAALALGMFADGRLRRRSECFTE